MASVDNRVVKMEFDNSKFESKVNQTISSLDKLTHALKFEGVKKGITDLSQTIKGINISEGVTKGIEGASKSFGILHTAAGVALGGIATKAASAGMSLAKSLNLNSVMDGFREYETNIGSIQTILANTDRYGTTLDQVTTNLDELNTYSDKTIYSFGEMVKNIGLFTNAGIKIEDATSMIKGFSNAAAASGTSAEGAAGAAYQLSQALSAGQVRLMDWKSLTNVGMGNKNMQQGLVEIADAMGTIDKNGTSSEEVMGNFNASLEKGWLSADVMSNYLKIMAGDMDAVEMSAMGLTDAQVVAFQHQQDIAEDAATKVRTFTQLMGTSKEALGSGWSASMRILVGNFTEATDLFTGINNSISGFISKSAESRNKVLNDWKFFGGRTLLIDGVKEAFHELSLALGPIKEAFRDVFPKKTAADLMKLTVGFTNFLKAIIPSQKTAQTFANVLKVFFYVIKIGINIVKEMVRFIGNLISLFTGMGGRGDVLGNMAERFARFFEVISKGLVEGNGIKKFFNQLTVWALVPIKAINKLIDAIVGFFQEIDFEKKGEKTSKGIEKVGESFSIFDRILARFGQIGRGLSTVFETILTALDVFWDAVADTFSAIGEVLSDSLGETDFNFDNFLDILNTGLLAGIGAVLYKFFKNPFKFDIGSGFLEKMGKMFEELGGTLKAFQAKVKSEALLKIAIAIAVLTGSLLVLSLIDSDALTKALIGMGVAFGFLMGSFALIDKLSKDLKSGATFTVIAVGLLILAGAILVLSIAAKILSTMSWDEIARGLGSVIALIGALTAAVKLMGENTGDMIEAGIGVMGLSVAMLVLSLAIKSFADMALVDIAVGLVTVSVGLIILSKAMSMMPDDLEKSGVGLIGIGIGLLLFARAIEKMGGIDLLEMAKGLFALNFSLRAIASAVERFGTANMPAIGLGLVLIGAGLWLVAAAVEKMGNIPFGEMLKGLGVMLVSLLLIAVAANAMVGTAGGAAAILVISAAMLVLIQVLQELAAMKVEDTLKGLSMMIIVLGALALAAYAMLPALPALILLGVAVGALGLGLALFGIGAFFAAKAMVVFAEAGEEGAKALTKALEAIGGALPALFRGFAMGIIELITTLGEYIPAIIAVIEKFVVAIIDLLIALIPKVGELVGALIQEVIDTAIEFIPQFALLGMNILLGIIQGIADNIGEVVTAVSDLINEFLDALQEEVPRTVTNMVETFVAIIKSFAYNLGIVAATLMGGVALEFIRGFIKGTEDNWHLIKEIWNALPRKVQEWIGSVINTLLQKGKDMIQGFLNGVKALLNVGGAVYNWFKNIGKKVTDLLPSTEDLKDILFGTGKDIIQGLWDGIKEIWEKAMDWLEEKVEALPGPFEKILEIFSPSRYMMRIGEYIIEGLVLGMQRGDDIETTATALALTTKKSVSKVVDAVNDGLASMGTEFNPVITPVLDLTGVRSDAQRIADYVNNVTPITAAASIAQAQLIATSPNNTRPDETGATVSGDGAVKFEQNIYAPTQLSTADIYRQTRNQIAMAKEELKIPS